MTFSIPGLRSVGRLLRMGWTMVRFGTIPWFDRVWFPRRGQVFFDIRDMRGRWLRSSAGVTQPAVTWLWGRLIAAAEPDLAIDVGANYGEVALSTRYPRRTRVILVEANPGLIPYLESSVATRRDRNAIQIAAFCATDESGTVRLTVDEKWSGGSSAVAPVVDADFKGPGDQRQHQHMVPGMALDEFLARDPTLGGGPVVIKADVEGGELEVLRGLKGTLRTRPDWAVILEYNRDQLAARSLDENFLVDFLLSCGELYLLTHRAWPVKVAGSSDILGRSTDLVLVKPGSALSDMVSTLRVPPLIRYLLARAHRRV